VTEINRLCPFWDFIKAFLSEGTYMRHCRKYNTTPDICND